MLTMRSFKKVKCFQLNVKKQKLNFPYCVKLKGILYARNCDPCKLLTIARNCAQFENSCAQLRTTELQLETLKADDCC